MLALANRRKCMNLWTTKSYEALGWDELAQIANGCGPAKCKWCAKYLDNALGLSVFEACAQHDVDYSIGGTAKIKRVSDIRFICNLIVIALEQRSIINVIRIPYLFLYFAAVSYAGRKHFNYRDDDDDNDT